MKIFKAASATVALATAAAIAAPSYAQTPPPVTGPVVPGICVFNTPRAIATSTAGQAIGARLHQLGASVQAEIEAEGNALQNEGKALQAKQATASKTQFETERGALQVKAQNFERKQQLRGVQLQITREKALQQVELSLQPIVRQTFQQRGCSVLIEAQATSFALFAPGDDLTDSVLAGLNAKLTSVPMDLASEQEALQAVQQQQQQGGR